VPAGTPAGGYRFFCVLDPANWLDPSPVEARFFIQ
jgi:hypothetical protein